ncbi:THUMP domain-containing protein 1 homolog [Topomyia yanbarensis]|uniref:THUMP domain-containing protein 1 homolog n=1 Tax=Topomyia yanbarensis TaxID=2498891 RepID=UPI00273B007A|nr:THUMP domain-containing protein 1 homolog [Topomyia yanbarensis]
MSTETKRPRMDGSKSTKKGKTDSRNYYAKAYGSHRKNYLEPGQHGFLVTCNMREKDCIRDSFRLLNEYADELYGKLGEEEKVSTKEDDPEEEEDISVLVEKQAETARTEKRQFRFESVDTGAKNCCFITTILKDPKELALRILRDLAESKKLKSRNILRLMPIEVVTKANLKDIIDAAGGLFDQYFLKEPKTFAIVFNRRYNNGLDRDSVINELAGLISAKNIGNKANLKHPDLAVIVEVIKGLCLISVVPEYYELRKYNLVEICAQKEEDEQAKQVVESVDKEVAEAGEDRSDKTDTKEVTD